MITLKNGNCVPCGKCPACLANQRAEWIFRLKQEYLACEFAIFVTLTYDEEHVHNDLSVNKKDVQLFHKRLRKHFPSGDLRYYVVSEYGDRTFRPHYHGLYFFKSNYNKYLIYQTFEEAWQNGFIKFGEVEEGSIVYCTKYCLKYKHVPEGRKPCFRLVSKMNGGLGINYLEKMGDYHAQTMNLNSVYMDGHCSRMPRYYLTRLQLDFSISAFDLQVFKAQRNERIQDQLYKEYAQKFKAFCESHKGHSLNEMISLFNAELRRSEDARDNLLIKHVKQQKL